MCSLMGGEGHFSESEVDIAPFPLYLRKPGQPCNRSMEFPSPRRTWQDNALREHTLYCGKLKKLLCRGLQTLKTKKHFTVLHILEGPGCGQ